MKYRLDFYDHFHQFFGFNTFQVIPIAVKSSCFFFLFSLFLFLFFFDCWCYLSDLWPSVISSNFLSTSIQSIDSFFLVTHFTSSNPRDWIPCSEITKRTKIIDTIEYTLKQKWRWAGHTARIKDNRWTKRCTEWQPRRVKRSRGRPCRRWQDGITRKEGTTWNRKATHRRQWKRMESYILQRMDKA